jgi:hypothetical protein
LVFRVSMVAITGEGGVLINQPLGSGTEGRTYLPPV